MTTKEVKKAVLLNYIASCTDNVKVKAAMAQEVDHYIERSPDEIKLYEEDKETARIIHGNN